MDFDIEQIGDIALIRVRGRLAFESISDFQEGLRDLIQNRNSKFIIDLSGMDFIDSAGLGVLVALSKRARENGGDLKVAAPQPQVRSFLGITGLGKIFEIYNVINQAIESFKKEEGD